MSQATVKEPRFRSAYSGSIRVNAPVGSPMQDEYGYEINSKGQKVLVKTGERNLYEEIQSYAEECKIENILKRVAIGDMSDFRPDGIYQDISEIPNNLIEARQEMQKLENLWNKLDIDTKRKYNFDVNEFMAQAGKEAWLIDTGFLKPVDAEKVTPAATDPEPTKVEVPKTE